MSFLLLFILWIIWNGKVTLEIAVLGVWICAVLYLSIRKFMGYGPERGQKTWKCCVKAFWYVLYLIAEIIKANFDTAKMILAFDMEPEPVLVKFRTDLYTEAGQVILANSITLTPGTLTVDLREGEYLVHCLDQEFAEGMEQSGFVKRIRVLEAAAGKKGEEHGA